MAVSEDSVEVQLRVGMLDLALAKLMTDDHHTIEFPTILLPEDVEAGSIVKLQCTRALPAEIEDRNTFNAVQEEILNTFATNLPEAPVLRAKNVTQTSVVLEWDPIQVASSDLHFLALYKGTQRLGLIPQPLKRTLTKVSNLEIDAPYDFRIVLSTSAGQFESNKLEIQTHKMADLTGVVVCVGSLAHSDYTIEKIEESLKRLGCVALQDSVKLDTTHFVCTIGGGAAFERAVDLNIPIVRPDWLQACENERRLVSVRGYYLSTDPTMYVNAKKEIPSNETPAHENLVEQGSEATESQVGETQDVGEQDVSTVELAHDEKPASNVAESSTHEKLEETQSSGPNSKGDIGGGNEVHVEQSKPTMKSDAPSSHDNLSKAVSNIGDQKMVEENYEIANSKQSREIPTEEHSAQVTEVQMDRELERELEEDPTAALREGEKHNVVLEESQAAEPHFGDVGSASPKPEASPKLGECSYHELNVEEAKPEASPMPESNFGDTSNADADKATKTTKGKRGKKNKKK